MTTNNYSSPPSPSTSVNSHLRSTLTDVHSIDSQTDSQTGGDYFPPSESAGSEVLEDNFNRARSYSQPSRRPGLSLNISALSTPFQNQFTSPSSLASSGAPYTDSYSGYNATIGQDYFHFDEASLSATDAYPPEAYPQPVPQQQYGYRLPASQPSSPVRSIYAPGQAPYIFQQGRQRGATFSGSFSPYGDFSGSPLYNLSNSTIASAVPTHLTVNTALPLAQSPSIISPLQIQPDSSYFDPQLKSGLGVEDVSMDDVLTPIPSSQPVAPALSRRPSRQTVQTDLTGDMVERLTLMDRCVPSLHRIASRIR